MHRIYSILALQEYFNVKNAKLHVEQLISTTSTGAPSGIVLYFFILYRVDVTKLSFKSIAMLK